MTSLNPVMPIGLQITEVLERHGACRGEAPGRGARAARAGRHPRPGPPARGLPAPALRRHAPAGDDRDGARLPTAAAHRRRADDRARRDDPGPDPGAAQASCVEETGAALIMITHDLGVVAGLVRPGQRDVRRAHRRARRPARRSSRAAPPVHRRAARLDPPPGRRRGASRCTPSPGRPTDDLPWADGCAFAPRCSQPIDVCVDGRAAGARRRTARHVPLRCSTTRAAERPDDPPRRRR